MVERGAVLTSEDHGKYLIKYSERNNESMVKYLLKHGVDPNWTNKYGECALFKAMLRRSQRACQVLVKKGASLDIMNKTPSNRSRYLFTNGYSFSGNEPTGESSPPMSNCSSKQALAASIVSRGEETDISPKELPVNANDVSMMTKMRGSHCGCYF